MTEPRPVRAAARRRVERPPDMPVEAFLDGFPPAMRDIAVHLREVVLRELPDAEERIRLHWRLLGYHLPIKRHGVFVAWVGPEAKHVHLGFPMGVLIDDPEGVLQGRGITKLARWLTYTSIDQIDEAVAVRYLRAAVAVAGLPRSAAG